MFISAIRKCSIYEQGAYLFDTHGIDEVSIRLNTTPDRLIQEMRLLNLMSIFLQRHNETNICISDVNLMPILSSSSIVYAALNERGKFLYYDPEIKIVSKKTSSILCKFKWDRAIVDNIRLDKVCF